MKKALSILSILIIILMLFTSCNSVSKPPVVPSETSFPSETVIQACKTADSVVVEQWPYEITTDSHYIAGIENISY